jgi:H+/gluconate symporter-like permease
MEEPRIFKEKESKIGPLIGSLVIVIVLVVGALYFLSQRITERKIEIDKEEKVQQETITEMDSLEKELQELNVEVIDQDIANIETDFDSI